MTLDASLAKYLKPFAGNDRDFILQTRGRRGTIEKEERYQSRRKGYKPFSDISRGSRSRKGFLAPCTVLLEAVLQTRDKGRPVLRFRQCERQLRLFTLASTSRTQARENIHEKKATRSKPSLFARHAPCNRPSFTPPSAILVNILPPLIHRRHSFSLFGLLLFFRRASNHSRWKYRHLSDFFE